MMRLIALAAVTAAASLGYSQTVREVYNRAFEGMYDRDTRVNFKLKSVDVESTVVGPIVRTSMLLTYDNPYTTMTEACLNFGLPDAAALSGFAYYYGDEYVKGELMDKNKAWFIYTAITSRGRDPGIMDQQTPTTYHCQIYPIKIGSDLRIRLYTVAFLEPAPDGLRIPKPQVPATAGYHDGNYALAKLNWSVRTVYSKPAQAIGDDYRLPQLSTPVRAIAQRFKDGKLYVSGLLQGHDGEPKLEGLNEAKTVSLGNQMYAFMGWLPHNKRLVARMGDERVPFEAEQIPSGNDAAKLWAQQMLAQSAWRRSADVLKFSLFYGVPSKATALLAVPSAEMKLFREKEKIWEQTQAEARKRQLEAARRRRNWASNRNQNWQASSGGDPEIRVSVPGARRVRAFLPDGRVLDLMQDGDTWGGNFEIPAAVPQGRYAVRVVAEMPDGSKVTKSWSYDVDRTAPKGVAKLIHRDGHQALEVRSEKHLNQVAAYAPDGEEWVLKEEEPGVYRVELPDGFSQKLKIVLKDQAGNKGEFEFAQAGGLR